MRVRMSVRWSPVAAAAVALVALIACARMHACAATTVNAAADALADGHLHAEGVDQFAAVDSLFGAEEAALVETEAETEAEAESEADVSAMAMVGDFAAPKKAAVEPKKQKAVTAKKAAAKAKTTKSAKAKTSKSAKATSKAKPAKSAKATSGKAKSTKAAKSTKSKSTKAAKSTKSAKTSKSSKASKSTKASKASKTTKKSSKATKSAKSAKTKDTKATKASKSGKAAKEPKTKKAAKDAKETAAATPKRNGKGRTGGAKFGATFGATPFSSMSSAEFKKKILNTWNHLKAGQKLRPRPSRKSKAKTSAKGSGDKAAAKSKIKKLAMRLLQVVQPAKKKTTTGTSSTGTAQPKLNGQNGPGLAVGTLLSNSVIARFRKEASAVPAPKSPKTRGLVDKDVDFSDWVPFVRTHSTCGACWAQVSADVVQASLVRAKGKKAFTVAPQWWMDCDVDGGNFRANLACGGGSVMNALQFSIKTGHSMMNTLKGGNGKWEAGVVYAETDYLWQYNSEGQHACQDNTKSTKRQYVVADWSYAVKPTHSLILDSSAANSANLAEMMGVEYQAPGNPDLALGGKQGAIKSGDREALLAKALNNFGPLAVIIDAVGLQRYTGGVATPAELGCSSDPEKGTHAMLLVGMQTADNGKKYWVIKNSWGRDWGEDGYLYLARGGDPCGITAAAVYVNIAGDKADPIARVAGMAADAATGASWVPESAMAAAAAVQRKQEDGRSARNEAAFALARGECDPNEMMMRDPSPELIEKCRLNDLELQRIKAEHVPFVMPKIVVSDEDTQKVLQQEKIRNQKLREIKEFRLTINQSTTKKTAAKPKTTQATTKTAKTTKATKK